jgi:demethylmenaquinone methyltransferase/2-methoxy-6-polyprenyl-1,4-benzoquinol methylase
VASLSQRNRAARDLFAPLGPSYDRWSRLLSLGQDPRWRRFLVSRIEVGRDDTVLDVATGTAAVAIELVRRTGCRVVGLDLLRYVEDRAATLLELARVVRPGGSMAALEFGLPKGVWRPLWEAYVRVGLPVAGRLISPGWHEVGSFLGPSIRDLHERLPLGKQLELWREAGVEDVRARRLSLGGGYVVWGHRA